VGVNLVTKVRGFYIEERDFPADSHDVQDGCITAGGHRVLRFDFLSHNAGNADLVIGSPAARPDLFVWSPGHGHYHLKDFNEFLLFDAGGNLATVGYKQAFCAIDIERIDPWAPAAPQFNDCNSNQGISAGYADVYGSGLACQFIVIDGLPDGDYTLQSTTNAQHKVPEDCYGDNTIWTGLRIAGNVVTTIDPPYIPEDRIPFDRGAVAAAEVGGRWKVVEGGTHWMLDTGTSQAEAQRAVEVINHYRLAVMCFVGRPRCGDVQPMSYWLTENGDAPTGDLPGEDAIAFDPDHLAVVNIAGRWKVVEGTHWLLDFGPGEGNAVAALHFLRKYGFNELCFIGRPGPSMTYFKKVPAGRRIRAIDPRVIDALIDLPAWHEDQRRAVEERVHTVAFATLPTQEWDSPLRLGDITLSVIGGNGDERITTGGTRGISGIVVPTAVEARLDAPSDLVDVILAHDGGSSTVTAYRGDAAVTHATTSDWPHQQELLRLAGQEIDRITVEANDGEATLVELRCQHAPQDA
jgi:hypothetical protein